MPDADPSSRVVTRFAPSPTGALHIGGARTALFNWAYARGRGGKFLLRMEDTDQKRSSEESARALIADMQWLGLHWDGEIEYQSRRLPIYREHVDRLLKGGLAYEDDGAVRLRMAKAPVTFSDAVLGQVTFGPEQLEDFVILKGDGFPTYHLAVVVDDALMNVTHVIRGQEHLSNTPKHIALQQALGFPRPVYAHLSSILNADGSKMSKRDKAKAARKAAQEWLAAHNDDIETLANVTGQHSAVIELFMERKSSAVPGQEAFFEHAYSSEATAGAIADALGVALPEIDVADFRDSGYLPDVLCNYIALLGWWPTDGVERFTLEQLVANFDLDRVSKSNAKFDRAKLAAFNGETLQATDSDEFADLLRQFMAKHCELQLDKLGDQFTLFAQTYQPRCQTLKDPSRLGSFFFVDDDAIEYDAKAVSKILTGKDGEGLTILREFQAVLDALQDWSADAIEAAVKEFAEKKSIGMGKVAQPLRVAVTGSTVSPPIGITLEILGKGSTSGRIGRCLLECAPPEVK